MLGSGLTDGLSSLTFPHFPKRCLARLPSEWSLQKLFSCRAVLGVVMKTFLSSVGEGPTELQSGLSGI